MVDIALCGVSWEMKYCAMRWTSSAVTSLTKGKLGQTAKFELLYIRHAPFSADFFSSFQNSAKENFKTLYAM